MKDINLPLRKAYIEKLTTPAIEYNGEEVPVWYSELPDGINANNYIIIGQIDNNDLSTKNSQDTSTTIRVAIHTHDSRYNSGDAADTIAGIVLQRIYPSDKSNIDLSEDGLQCVSTDLSGDNVQDYSAQGNRKYIDRTLTFRHYIFHR